MSSEPMGWEDFALARQLLTEETVGHALREAKAIEDAEFRQSKSRLRG